MYMVAAKIHSNKTGAVMCIDQAFGTETSIEEHYRTILGELSLLAQDRQTLSKLPPGFLAKHMSEPAKELVTSDPARYGWLASCILLDCTDEHVQGTNDSAGHRRLLSTKPHTSSPALTYLRAHLFDLWALWTSRGHPPNDFHHDGQTNVDTEVAVVDSFWDELIGLAQSQGVAVIHVLADKAYRFVRLPEKYRGRIIVHVNGPLPDGWHQEIILMCWSVMIGLLPSCGTMLREETAA